MGIVHENATFRGSKTDFSRGEKNVPREKEIGGKKQQQQQQKTGSTDFSLHQILGETY